MKQYQTSTGLSSYLVEVDGDEVTLKLKPSFGGTWSKPLSLDPIGEINNAATPIQQKAFLATARCDEGATDAVMLTVTTADGKTQQFGLGAIAALGLALTFNPSVAQLVKNRKAAGK